MTRMTAVMIPITISGLLNGNFGGLDIGTDLSPVATIVGVNPIMHGPRWMEETFRKTVQYTA